MNINKIMKNTPLQFLFLLFLLLIFSQPGFSQEQTSKELHFEVNRIYPAIVISQQELTGAIRLEDINPRYQSSWVREYLAVEIGTINDGEMMKSIGDNSLLTAQQKERMEQADAGSEIAVKVRYIPENNLKQQEPKEMTFNFSVNPAKDAQFPGGSEQLRKYLREKVMAKIPEDSFQGYDMTAVKFTINKEGEISNAHLFGTDYANNIDEQRDALLLATIRQMPCWKPAEYADGTKVAQEFALTVGNMENCWVNLLNIDPDKF